MSIIVLPERYAFVRKDAKGVYHIAQRNIYSRKPIRMSSCSFDVGAGHEWPSVTSEADAGSVCKKCANSVFGYRWREMSE